MSDILVVKARGDMRNLSPLGERIKMGGVMEHGRMPIEREGAARTQPPQRCYFS